MKTLPHAAKEESRGECVFLGPRQVPLICQVDRRPGFQRKGISQPPILIIYFLRIPMDVLNEYKCVSSLKKTRKLQFFFPQ